MQMLVFVILGIQCGGWCLWFERRRQRYQISENSANLQTESKKLKHTQYQSNWMLREQIFGETCGQVIIGGKPFHKQYSISARPKGPFKNEEFVFKWDF